MSNLKDSSEIQEAVALLEEFVSQSAVVAPPEPERKGVSGIPGSPVGTGAAKAEEGRGLSGARPEPLRLKEIVPEDRLEKVLFDLCSQCGFSGAVVADEAGLPLVVFSSPFGDDTMAALTTLLAEVLNKARKLLDPYVADTILLDISDTDKALLKRLFFDERPYFLLIICPNHVDLRGGVAFTVDQVTSMLNEG